MYKINDKSKKNPLHYIKLINFRLRNINLISKTPHRRQVVHSGPHTPQGESVAKSETLMLIILGLVRKCDINEILNLFYTYCI